MMQKSLIKLLGVSMTVVLLSACSAETYKDKDKEKEVAMICPNVLITKDTAQITKTVNNQALWQAQMTGYKGHCYLNKDNNEIGLDLRLDFTAELIKPDIERAFTVRYYVAAPALYPDAVGKQNFYLDVVFPNDKNKVDIRNKAVNLSFPMTNEKGQRVDIKDVYIGIQLDKEQLEFNRNKIREDYRQKIKITEDKETKSKKTETKK